MANGGSRKWFNYTSDEGQAYAIERDESNGEATVSGNAILSTITVTAPLIPCRFRPRYVNTVLQSDPTRRKRWDIGVRTVFNDIGAGSTVVDDVGTWSVTSKVGEKSVIPNLVDTGLTDGDQP